MTLVRGTAIRNRGPQPIRHRSRPGGHFIVPEYGLWTRFGGMSVITDDEGLSDAGATWDTHTAGDGSTYFYKSWTVANGQTDSLTKIMEPVRFTPGHPTGSSDEFRVGVWSPMGNVLPTGSHMEQQLIPTLRVLMGLGDQTAIEALDSNPWAWEHGSRPRWARVNRDGVSITGVIDMSEIYAADTRLGPFGVPSSLLSGLDGNLPFINFATSGNPVKVDEEFQHQYDKVTTVDFWFEMRIEAHASSDAGTVKVMRAFSSMTPSTLISGTGSNYTLFDLPVNTAFDPDDHTYNLTFTDGEWTPDGASTFKMITTGANTANITAKSVTFYGTIADGGTHDGDGFTIVLDWFREIPILTISKTAPFLQQLYTPGNSAEYPAGNFKYFGVSAINTQQGVFNGAGTTTFVARTEKYTAGPPPALPIEMPTSVTVARTTQ